MALQELTRPGTKTMQEAAQLPSSPDGQSLYQPQSVSSLQDKAGTLSPQPQHEPVASRETLLQQHDKDVTVPRHIPRLRAVVESQAFKNVLVDEMDMMLSRAATLIQANWRGYRLRQKLISQMKAAKAIQEAWRRFNTRRLLHSGKPVGKKVSVDEGDIPYHAPQQVRFQPPGEVKPPVAQPVMVSKETQFPSSDSLDTCTHQLALLQAQGGPQPGMQAPGSTGGPSVTFLPHQTIAIRLPCPVNLDAKCHPCLMTRTVRNACLVHVEGDMVKTKQVTTRANKTGAPGPPPCGRYAQAVHGSLKTQTQGHVETEVLKTPPQTGPALVINKTAPQMYPATTMTKTPPQPCVAPMVTIAKTPPQVYPAAPMTKTPTQMNPAAAVTKTPPQPYPAVAMPKSPLQSCLVAMMSKTLPPPCSTPTVMITKALPQTYPVAPMAKSPPQTCPVAAIVKASPQTSQPATMTKTPLQSGLGGRANKTPTQPCPVAPMSKTPTQMRPTASMTNASPQTRPAAMMAKISPQICLLASMIKPPTQTRPVATMGKAPPQTCPVPAMAKTPAQMRPAAPMTKTPLQTCPAAAMAKTPSQMLPGTSMTKTPPQTRLAAMVTKTPAQLRSMAAILKTLCLPPSAAGNLKSSPPATVAAGIPNASSRTCLSGPKAKATVNAKQTAGMVRVSSHSYLAEGKVKYFNAPHLGAGSPKAPARPPLEAERMKAFSQKQVKIETGSSSSVAIEMSRASPWVKMAEDRNKSSLQTCPRTDVVKVQPQVYVPMETAVVLPRAQLAPCPTKVPPQTHLETCVAKGLPQEQLATCATTASSQLTAALPQAHLGTCLSKTLSKTLSQAHPPTKLTKTPSFAHLGTCLTKAQSRAHLASRVIKVQSKAHLSTELTKAQSQAQLVTETAKCLYAAQHSAELSGKTQSQPLLAGFKVSTQPCKHTGALGNLPRAKPEDRLTQIQPHSYVQGKGTQGPSQGPCETQSTLVPLVASAGHPTCNIESWGDSGATRAQSPMPGPATPCPEELAASQLASLCAELAAELGSEEDLRALLTKALSQGQVRAALNQALTKKALGSTMAKALPQGKLGTALMKVLSWGELGLALSRTLSPGELRAELTKAKQGKLADVLSKALTEEEWAALSQALCQGELGAVLSQSLSQAALRTGIVLPKAASKTAGSRMSVIPAPVEVDCRGIPAAAWGSAVGPVRPQPSKVRVPQDGAWEGFFTGWPAGFLEEMGDGAMFGGSPCSPVVSVGASLASRVISAIHQHPLIAALDPSRGGGSDLHLNPAVSEENVRLPPGPSELASDLNPVESDTGPSLPKPPHLQPPPSLWQPLIANGVGPSTSQQSVVAGGTARSSHSPHAVSRVAPRPWASSGEGRAASGARVGAAGRGSATHSHQCAAAYGGSVCWCQYPGVNKVPSSMYRASTKARRQPSMLQEETMQKTQSPNHKRASVDTRERINKATPGALRGASGSKVSLGQPQTPKTGDTTLGLLHHSMAPGHRWALKTQVEAGMFPASPGSRSARTLSRTGIPRQERTRTLGASAGVRCAPEQGTGHILNEVASLAQSPDNDMAGSLSQGSTDYGPNVSNSQSSLPSGSSPSPSTMSVASLTAVDLVEEESWEASFDTLLSGEAVESPQGPRDREKTKRGGGGHTSPNLYPQPSAGSELIPILHHSSVSGRMTLSVHWGSDDQEERDASSGQSSMGLTETLPQKSYRTGLTRSLSLDNVVPTMYQQPSVASRLTSSLSQPLVVSKVAPNPGQPSVVSKVTTSPSELSMASKVIPSLTEPSVCSKVNLGLDRKSWTSQMNPSLAQPYITGGVATNLVQPSVTGEVAPSLAQPSGTHGFAPNLAQTSMTGALAPSLTQPPVTGRVAPSLAQASVTSGVATSLAWGSMTGGVAPSIARPSVISGVASSLAQASLTSVVAPSLARASVTSGVAPSLARPSVTGGVAPSLAQASMTSGVAPSLARPSVTGGVAPSLPQASMTGGVAPSLARLSVTSGVAPSLARASMTSGVASNLAQASVTGGVAPSLAQASMTSGVAPSLARPSMSSGVTPSLAKPCVADAMTPSLTKPSMTDGEGPTIAQPSVTGGVTPSLTQAPVACVVAPSLHQPSVTSGVAPSLGQPSVACVVAPSLAPPSVGCVMVSSLCPPPMTGGVAPSLAQPFVANRGPLSLFQPSVIAGTSCAAGQSGWAPKVGSDLPSRVSAVAPSLGHPSLVTEVPLSSSYSYATSSTGPDLSQSPVATSMAPCQDPVMVDGVASNPQAHEFSQVSLTFHQPLGVSRGHPSVTEHSAVPLSAPDLFQASGASGEDSCLDQGTNPCPGALFPGVATGLGPGTMAAGLFPNMSRGTLAAGMFLSMSPGSLSPGMTGSVCQRSVATGMGPNQFQGASGLDPRASPASGAGAPLIHEQASEVGPGFSRASVPNRLGMSPIKFSQADAGPSMSQVNVDIPISLNQQHPSVTTVVAPGYEQANDFSQEPVVDTASGLVPGSVPSRMTTAMAPGTVASGVAPSLAPGSVIRGVGQSLPPGSVISGVPPHLPPGFVVSGVPQNLPEGSVIYGISHSLPPGSVISGMGQGLPPDPVASAVAQNFPPGSVASGVPPSLIATSGAGGKGQSFVRPSFSFTVPSLISGSVAGGMVPGVSPRPVTSSVVPAIDSGELNQGLMLESTDNVAGLPSTVGNVAQSLPQGSMLIGITPRPYHGALAREGSTAPFQGSHVTGLAQLHPQALEASGTTRRVHRVPTVLQRATQLSHALEMMSFETTDDQVMRKPEDLSQAVSQVSVSSAESMVLDATPWMPQNPPSADVSHSHSQQFFPDGQRPLLEMVPSQTKSLTSGMAPVPPQSLSFAKPSMAGSTTLTLPPRSATSWGAPSSHFVTASTASSVHIESVKAVGAPLARRASVAHIVPQSPSVTHVVPQGHPHKMGASPIASASPKLSQSRSRASSVHPGSVVGVGTPSTSQKSGTTYKASHVLYPPMAGGVGSGGFQVDVVPRAHKKPAPGDLAQSSHKSLGSRKSYRSVHGYLVSDMLDSNVARVVPLYDVQEHVPRSSQESPGHAESTPPAVTPIIRTMDMAPNVAAPRLHPGFRRVSLGYESSPDGSRRPLFTPESTPGSWDFQSAVVPAGCRRVSLTPTVLQGPVDAGIAGGQAWNSAAVPSGAAGPTTSAVAPGGAWDLASGPWDTMGREAAVDPRQSGEQVTSLQAMEKVVTHAVVTIQACARGYLVRRTIRVWHQWAVIIQAAWRGYRVRRDLARLSQAATTIQATWRGFRTRRIETQLQSLPGVWTKADGRTRSTSDHRCFQSCQPHVCPYCQSLSPNLGSPPSVVMLVGSSPRTCHMCGHTLPTRVVHGVGRGSRVQASMPWGCDTPRASQSPQQSHRQNKAATTIQSAWRGFAVRRQLRQQQMAARMLQANWRGHHTRVSLTPDALLGAATWDNPEDTQWPGV
ncbi:IQ domain-containing protein N [Lontra canadensis]|uniref:IQ domain-containing protein N n=1 Tax=Lontra canadensis TaxID=76717 RepID=UPI0013F340B1|nr:IQ domain-containing protein N [Lontra canadensis]